jgi:hypothetical protein
MQKQSVKLGRRSVAKIFDYVSDEMMYCWFWQRRMVIFLVGLNPCSAWDCKEGEQSFRCVSDGDSVFFLFRIGSLIHQTLRFIMCFPRKHNVVCYNENCVTIHCYLNNSIICTDYFFDCFWVHCEAKVVSFKWMPLMSEPSNIWCRGIRILFILQWTCITFRVF